MAKNNNLAITGLVLGICSIPGAFVPIFGLPLGILGLIFSLKGMNQHKNMSIAGLVCSILGLVFTVANAAIGFYIAYSGIA